VKQGKENIIMKAFFFVVRALFVFLSLPFTLYIYIPFISLGLVIGDE
jgi:hypothetical protein